MTSGPFAEVQPVCSPDGKWLLFEYFHADRPAKPQLWIMPAHGTFAESRPLVDDENYNAEASWSPDSKWVSYETIRTTDHAGSIQLFKINVFTKEKIQLTDLSQQNIPGDSTSWSIEGRIAFEMQGDIYAVDEGGREVRKVADVRSKYPDMEPSLIRWSPDAAKLCFVEKGQGTHKPGVWIYDRNTDHMRFLADGDFPWWFDNRHILLSRQLSESESNLLLVPIAGGRAETVTHGYLDVTPVSDAKRFVVFFARGLPSRPNSNNLNLFEGFHIWQLSLPRSFQKRGSARR